MPRTAHSSAVLNILVRRTTGKALLAKDVILYRVLFLPFSYGQLAMTKPLKGSKEPKVGNAKGLNFLRSHPRV